MLKLTEALKPGQKIGDLTLGQLLEGLTESDESAGIKTLSPGARNEIEKNIRQKAKSYFDWVLVLLASVPGSTLSLEAEEKMEQLFCEDSAGLLFRRTMQSKEKTKQLLINYIQITNKTN